MVIKWANESTIIINLYVQVTKLTLTVQKLNQDNEQQRYNAMMLSVSSFAKGEC